MKIGDKSRFAVEFELDPTGRTDPDLAFWLYGRIRWWCGNEPVGRYDDGATIRDVAVSVGRFVQYRGKRSDPELFRSPAGEVLSTVKAALFEDRGQTDEQIAADSLRYRRFWITPRVDEFDGCDLVLVEHNDRGRLLWRTNDLPGPREARLANGEFDSVATAFLKALDDPRLLQ